MKYFPYTGMSWQGNTMTEHQEKKECIDEPRSKKEHECDIKICTIEIQLTGRLSKRDTSFWSLGLIEALPAFSEE